jgi:pre-mRNA-splicing factor ATP-dependent RNA helicase DHX38/PRP16
MLAVHDLKPPFLDGSVKFSVQTEQIQIMKNTESQLAISAKKGSDLLKETRERSEKQRGMDRYWELAGSKLGKLLGF